MRLAGFGIGLGRAVEECSTDARFLQAGDAGVGVLGRGIVVAPVDQRGDAVVELVEGAGQRGDVDVLGREHRGQAGMDVPKVLEQRPVGSDRAQRCLPGVHVGVDQPRQHEVPAAVDRLGVGSLQRGRNGHDTVAIDQHVALGQHAKLRVLRDDDA